MIKDKNTIELEMERIASLQEAFAPISKESLSKAFPDGPDGIFIIEGTSRADLVEGVRQAAEELKTSELPQVTVFIDSGLLTMSDLSAIDEAFSDLSIWEYSKGINYSGPEGTPERITVLFRQWDEKRAAKKRKKMLNRKGSSFMSVFWKSISGKGHDKYRYAYAGLTADEYEKMMDPLRQALRKEAEKAEAETYPGLTIRQFAALWEQASGGRHWNTPLEEMKYWYDLDSEEDFVKWSSHLDHFCDLDYPSIRFIPECVDWFEAIQEKGKGTQWQLILIGHMGDPVILARYAKRLQEAGVHFLLRDAKEVLRSFNKDVGYTKRSLRLKEKRKNDHS